MVSFVIRTKNEENKIENVLKSIRSQKTSEKIEIIIVDSGSIDSTLNIAQKYGCKVIKISPNTFTWGYALNIGVRNANGDIIGIISGHCILIDDYCVERICSAFKKDYNLAAIYGRQEGNNSDDPFEKYNNSKYYPNVDGLHYLSQEKNYGTTISNACCFLRKSVWNDVKYDEKIQSCEDAKWADEVISKGYELAYCGDIGVYHSHKLNYEYLYKKSFWREYEMKIIRKDNNKRVFYFVKFMIKHLIYDMIYWKKNLCRNVKNKQIWAYCFITNIACYKASVIKNINLKYQDISIPKHVRKVGEKL